MFEQIKNGEVELKEILKESFFNAIDSSDFELQILSENDDNISELDNLITDTFPNSEAEEYKPSQIYNEDDKSLCIAILSRGVVYGCIHLSFNFDEEQPTMVVRCLAVDERYRRKKLGSMLLLAAHDVAIALEIKSVALITSDSGKQFYESFGFIASAHQSYSANLPFSTEVINSKIEAFEQVTNANNLGM